MLEPAAILLVLLWIVGYVSAYTMGGLIHLLLVLAAIAIVVQVFSSKNPFGKQGIVLFRRRRGDKL